MTGKEEHTELVDEFLSATGLARICISRRNDIAGDIVVGVAWRQVRIQQGADVCANALTGSQHLGWLGCLAPGRRKDQSPNIHLRYRPFEDCKVLEHVHRYR